jgi:hypothetical protein
MPHPTLEQIAIEVGHNRCTGSNCRLNITDTTLDFLGFSPKTFNRDGQRIEWDRNRYQNSILCEVHDRRFLVTTHFGNTTWAEVPPGIDFSAIPGIE